MFTGESTPWTGHPSTDAPTSIIRPTTPNRPRCATPIWCWWPEIRTTPAEACRGIVIDVEVQRKRAQNKRRRIAGYLGGLEDEYDLPAMLALVSFSRALSEEALTWGIGPGIRFDTLVLDVDTVSVPSTIDAALERPTAAVLAAALHGCRGDLDAARMGIAACRGLPQKRRERYISTIFAAVQERRRSELLEEMKMTLIREDELWEIERGSILHHMRLEAAREQGREEGRRTTLVEVILAVLEVRGFELDADMRTRIRSCESLTTLREWARRARDVTRAHDLFDPL